MAAHLPVALCSPKLTSQASPAFLSLHASSIPGGIPWTPPSRGWARTQPASVAVTKSGARIRAKSLLEVVMRDVLLRQWGRGRARGSAPRDGLRVVSVRLSWHRGDDGRGWSE